MQTSQWPLTAASTQILIGLPPAGVKGSQAPPAGEAFKLGLKELLVRGAFRMEVSEVSPVWGKPWVVLHPAGPVALPDALAFIDGSLRPWTPSNLPEAIKAARSYNPQLTVQAREWFLWELSQRGLIERYQHKALGIFSQYLIRRTPTGDAWAATANQHGQRLQMLPWEAESDPDSAAAAAAAAGALALMVPASMAALAKLHRRRHHLGAGGYEDDFVYVTDDGMGFDPFSGTADMFDSAVGGMDAVDSGGGAVDAALDSVASSVDSAVDSGVDAGGGGDSGGGGGDSGGGGDGGGGGDSGGGGDGGGGGGGE